MTARKQLGVVVGILLLVAAAVAAGRYFLSDELEPVGLE
jgi:hypothetical protein